MTALTSLLIVQISIVEAPGKRRNIKTEQEAKTNYNAKPFVGSEMVTNRLII